MEWVFEYLADSMTALLAAAVCAAIALAAILALLFDLLRNRTGGKGGSPDCSWSKDSIKPHGDSVRWVCARCGAFSFGQGDSAPVTCRRYEPKQAP